MPRSNQRHNPGDDETDAHVFVWPPRVVPEQAVSPGDQPDNSRTRQPMRCPPRGTQASASPSSPESVSAQSSSSRSTLARPVAEPTVVSKSSSDTRRPSPSELQGTSSTPTADPAVASIAHPIATSSRPFKNSARLAFQRVWLDLVTPPLTERLALAEWAPDAPGVYCERCGHTIGPHEADSQGCRLCVNLRLPWQHVIRLSEYLPPISTIIHEIKFTKWRRLGIDAGCLLAGAIKQHIQDHRPALEKVLSRPPILVPVPTSLRRRFFRGIDHTRTIVRGVASAMPCEVVHALGRRHRPSQLNVAAHLRISNVSGTMWLRVPPERLAGRLVIVIDDVTTTGATLRAATKAIADAFQASRRKSENRKNSEPSVKQMSQSNPQIRAYPTIWAGVLAVTEMKDRQE